jgi:hypothetical protein
MGRINLTSMLLAIGAVGQFLFYGYLFGEHALKLVFAPLMLPWFAVYSISFCRQAPCGMRTFGLILTAAMCWYATATLFAEALFLVFRPSPHGHYTLVLPRVLMYVGSLSLFVFLRFIKMLRQHHTSETS